jgi:hypothetical protein
VLDTVPSANVVITLAASGSKVTLSTSTLTFTAANYSTPQTITITAVDDTTVEGTHSDTIAHTAVSVDGGYNGISIGSVAVTITDNDTAANGGSGGTSDTTPPSNTSVIIAGGATSTVNSSVILTLTATDAYQMMVANDSAFTSSTWETYATSKSWTLTGGAGTKTVYAKFKDATGNISTAVSDTIDLTTSVVTPPIVTPPVVTLPTADTTLPAVTTELPAPTVLVSNEDSKVIITPPATGSYQPGAKLKFNYYFTNPTGKVAKFKVVRQLVNTKNKAVTTVTLTKSFKKGERFVGKVNESLPANLPAGEYIVKVIVYDAKNKLVDQNSFPVTMEKKKNKYLVLADELSAPADIAFDETSWNKVKTNVKLPTVIKLKYSYSNSTDAKHTIKMVRELLDSNGKVVQTRIGKWTMIVGEKDSLAFTQIIPATFAAGDYTIRIRAYDWISKELLAENSVGFSVEFK